jgi:hypothetical protein
VKAWSDDSLRIGVASKDLDGLADRDSAGLAVLLP